MWCLFFGCGFSLCGVCFGFVLCFPWVKLHVTVTERTKVEAVNIQSFLSLLHFLEYLVLTERQGIQHFMRCSKLFAVTSGL